MMLAHRMELRPTAKQALRPARRRRRVRNVRQDFLDMLTTKLAHNHSQICMEDLNVSGMAKRHSLAVHIQDAAWGETRRQLDYKTVLYGSKRTVRDRFYASSKPCPACGGRNALLFLSDRVRTRLNCGALPGRDHNAAIHLVQSAPQAIASRSAKEKLYRALPFAHKKGSRQMPNIVSTDRAPKAMGAYSQAVLANGFAFLSGQIPLDPATGQLIDGDTAAQTRRVLDNLKAVLEACGSSLDQVVKTTVYLKSMDDFLLMNDVYKRYFPADPPARATVEVARLPRDVRVEIDCIALVG